MDMAHCANAGSKRAAACYADGGKIVDRFDFPRRIFAYPRQEVGNGLRRMQSRLKERGSPFDKPLFALIFLPFVTLPALRITARGLVNAKERRIVPLFAD
jgi:hypothetical protein